MNLRRWSVALGVTVTVLALAGCGSTNTSAGGSTKHQKTLTTVTFAGAVSAPNPLFENIDIGEALGYFAAQGIKPIFVNTGANSADTALLANGQAQIAVGTPSYQVGLVAAGQSNPGIDYYEYSYPSKWYLVVAPNSPIHSISQLAGKKVGIVSLGTADEPVLDSLLKEHGVNPSSVNISVVGSGTPAGVALDNGSLDAYFTWDSILGAFNVAGLKYKVILSPTDMPKVGGFYLMATPAYLKSHRAIAVGFARAVAEATVFALANPKAAAELWVKMFPTAGSTLTLQEQAKDVQEEVALRSKIWLPYRDKSEIGYIQHSEWLNELRFDPGGSSVHSGVDQFYTDGLIHAIDNFSIPAIQKQARGYKVKL